MEIAILKITSTRVFAPNEAICIRGYLSRCFPEEVLLHQHNGNNLIYTYPYVQYKVINGQAVIIGITEGRRVVEQMSEKIISLRLGGQNLSVVGKDLICTDVLFGNVKTLEAYSFLTPWLALNEENYERYKNSNQREQIQLLEKILIGNILSMAKGLEYVVTEEIKVKNLKLKMQDIRIKNIKMIGFIGHFEVNFNLPNYIGLGKMVSKGFGTIKKTNEKQEI